MTTCENCGADTLDARGVCRNCGWQTADARFEDTGDNPSLGETRAADIAPPQQQHEFDRRTPASGFSPPRTAAMQRYGTPEPASATPRGSATGTTRYCGTCGARIEPGEAFCGQCGTPVGASGDFTRNVPAGSPSRYHQTGRGDWEPASGDALTEEYGAPPLPPVTPYNRPSTYAQGHFGPAQPPPVAAGSRTGRTVWGLVCLAGSVMSAAGAVYLALMK